MKRTAQAIWRWFRGLRVAFVVSFLAGAALLFFGYDLMQAGGATGRLVSAAFTVVNTLYVGSWLAALLWPCPRCGKPFMFRWRSLWPLHRECQHCGLEHGSPVVERRDS